MTYHKLRINFAMARSDDWLKIEQVEPEDKSFGGFGEWLASMGRVAGSIENAFRLLDRYQSLCTEGDGCFIAELKVHKSRPDLSYSFFQSYGELSGRAVHTEEHTKSITVQMAEEISLEHMPTEFHAVWEGVVLNDTGQHVNPPQIFRTGNVLRWAGVVAGVLRVNWKETHDFYTLTLPPRPGEEYDPNNPETAYQSTVYATFAGNIEIHEVDLPDMSGNCAGGVSYRINSGDDEDDGDDGGGDSSEDCVRHVVIKDCTGVIDEWDEPMTCPGA